VKARGEGTENSPPPAATGNPLRNPGERDYRTVRYHTTQKGEPTVAKPDEYGEDDVQEMYETWMEE
jgi:hypothetical protein